MLSPNSIRSARSMPPFVLLLCLFAAAPSVQASDIKSDEVVLFFPTAANWHEENNEWVVPIHGWIFEPEEDDWLRSKLLEQIQDELDLEESSPEGKLFASRLHPFLVDSESGKNVEILIGEKSYRMPTSGLDGHFRGRIQLPGKEAEKLAPDMQLTFRAKTRPGDARVFEGRAFLLPPTGLSVVSDIDDTIKISNVASKRQLLEGIFLKEFEAAPGMNALYQKWEAQGASFHYVTLSPWQLYGVYSAFMTKEGFPAGTFHMTHFGIVDGSILKRMTSAMDRKLPMVKALMEQFPQREFVLVGDSGQHDPEVYGAVARDYGDRVKAIFIRNVSEESPDSARLQNAFRGVPAEKWKLFTDAATLSLD